MYVGCHKRTYVQCIYEQYMYIRMYVRTYGRNWLGGGWWVLQYTLTIIYVEPHVSDVPCAPVAAGH